MQVTAIHGLKVTRVLAGPQVAESIKVIVVTTFDLDEYVGATSPQAPATTARARRNP